MPIEVCGECGFDGGAYTDDEAIDAARTLPDSWSDAVKGLRPDDLHRRPIDGMWSIAEYSDHVRETASGMRFLLDIILTSPGTCLGDSPKPRFAPAVRVQRLPSLAGGGQGPYDSWRRRTRLVLSDEFVQVLATWFADLSDAMRRR